MVKKKRPSMKEYLGKQARIYEKRMGLKRIKTKATVIALDLLNIPKGSYILDVGCGSGWSTEVISSEGYKVVGIDVSKDMIKIAREKGYDARVMDMRNMKFKDDTFDGIVSISALNFITEDCKNKKEIRAAYRKVARGIYRILKDKGRAVIEYYPKTEIEEKISTEAFTSAGFSGELIKNIYKKKKGQRFLNLTKEKNIREELLLKHEYYRF